LGGVGGRSPDPLSKIEANGRSRRREFGGFAHFFITPNF